MDQKSCFIKTKHPGKASIVFHILNNALCLEKAQRAYQWLIRDALETTFVKEKYHEKFPMWPGPYGVKIANDQPSNVVDFAFVGKKNVFIFGVVGLFDLFKGFSMRD